LTFSDVEDNELKYLAMGVAARQSAAHETDHQTIDQVIIEFKYGGEHDLESPYGG
jgi:hypothetical protein